MFRWQKSHQYTQFPPKTSFRRHSWPFWSPWRKTWYLDMLPVHCPGPAYSNNQNTQTEPGPPPFPPLLPSSVTFFTSYCTVLYCSILYYTVLYCTVLYCTVSSFYTVLSQSLKIYLLRDAQEQDKNENPDIFFSLICNSFDLYAQRRHAMSSSQMDSWTAGERGAHSLTADEHSGTWRDVTWRDVTQMVIII